MTRVADSRSFAEHAVPTRMMLELLRETGRGAEAGKVAADYLSKRDSWVASTSGGETGVLLDVMPLALAAARDAGRVTPGNFAAGREAWAAAWRSKLGAAYAGFVWVGGYASVADSRESAVLALDALSSFGGVAPPLAFSDVVDTLVGETYASAGRLDEAFPILLRGTSECWTTYWPVDQTRGLYVLAGLLESRGDKAGACSALSTVLARWDHAKPASRTADAARADAHRMGCKAP
jgi:hypothetical protein